MCFSKRGINVIVTIFLAASGFGSEPASELTILSQDITTDAKGHRTIMNRVAPPPPQPLPAVINTSSVEQESEEPETPSKPLKVLALSCTVYDGPVTEMRWGNGYHVFINIDFLDLCGIGQFETASAFYSLMFSVSKEHSATRATQEPPLPSLSTFPSESSYQLVAPQGVSQSDPELLALNDLLSYYQANKATLQQLRVQREAEAVQRQQELLEQQNAPKPDTVINYWPIKSRLHQPNEEVPQ